MTSLSELIFNSTIKPLAKLIIPHPYTPFIIPITLLFIINLLIFIKALQQLPIKLPPIHQLNALLGMGSTFKLNLRNPIRVKLINNNSFNLPYLSLTLPFKLISKKYR